MNEENAKKLLFDIANCLESIEFPYFLYGGTLLGAVRERRFIRIDRDIDLGCLSEDFVPVAREINKLLNDAGFKTEFIDHRHNGEWDGSPYAIKFSKYGEHGDLASWTKKGESRFCPSHALNCALVHPASLLETVEQIEFYGRTFSIPCNVGALLTHKYGKWKIPHKQFYNVSLCRGGGW